MNRLQLNQSLKDLLPTYPAPYPPQLVACTDSLYQMSLQKIPSLPHKADVARHHLCAFLAIEKYKARLSLPSPLLHMIPLQPKLVHRVLADLELKVVVACASPVTTPKKLRLLLEPVVTPIPDLLPSKRPYAPGTSSPLKKLQKHASDATAVDPHLPLAHKALRDQGSPFNVKPRAEDGATNTPLASPKKTPRLNSSLKTPARSPANHAAASPTRGRYLRRLSVADFVSFANNFYIPASVTPQLLETFLREQHKFLKRNDWLLACGLIHAAYIRINHRILHNTLGRKTEFQDQLFQYQKGGLMKASIKHWLNIIEESVKNEPWALDLERKYVHNDWSTDDTSHEQEICAKLGRGWDLLLTFGSMINPLVMFDSASQVEYYCTWTERVHEKIRQVSEQQ